MGRSGAAPLRVRRLVAGYNFGGFFLLDGVSVAIGMAVTVSIVVTVAVGWRDGYGLAGVGEIGWDRFGYLAYRADLHYRRLRLLQHQLFVDGADFGLFFVGLFAADTIFFGRGQRNIVLEVANARVVFGVDL